MMVGYMIEGSTEKGKIHNFFSETNHLELWFGIIVELHLVPWLRTLEDPVH